MRRSSCWPGVGPNVSFPRIDCALHTQRKAWVLIFRTCSNSDQAKAMTEMLSELEDYPIASSNHLKKKMKTTSLCKVFHGHRPV
jgi:hypothetical protein